MTKSIYHLYYINHFIDSLPKEILCERILKCKEWCQKNFREFLEMTSKYMNYSSENSVNPEELIYQQSVKLAKDGAFSEFLGNVDSNLINMYKRSKYLLEYLVLINDFSQKDKEYLKNLTHQVEQRIQSLCK